MTQNRSYEFIAIVYLKESVFTDSRDFFFFFLSVFTLSGLISEVMAWLNEENRMFIDDQTEKYVFILPAWSSKHICSEPSLYPTTTCGDVFIAVYESLMAKHYRVTAYVMHVIN